MAGASILLPSGVYVPAANSYTQDTHTVFPEQTAAAEPPATTGSITASGAGNAISADVQGYATAVFELTGSYSGLIGTWEGSTDGGSTYTGMLAVNLSSGASTAIATANGKYAMACASLTHVRINPAAFSSGTLSVRTNVSAGTLPQYLNVLALGDGTGVPTAPVTGAMMMSLNGTSFDLFRGNVNGTAIASGARTATNNSSDIVNYNGRGVVIMLNVTSAGTGSIQVNVQGKDPVSAGYYKLAADPTAVTTAALFVYEFYPGASTAGAGGVTVRTAGVLPRTWRVIVTHGNANSMTYSVGYSMIV